jgi:hypothetical protein
MKIIPQSMPSDQDLGWSAGFPRARTVNGFYWNANANVLYTGTPTQQFNVWLNVSQGIATAFLADNPDEFYRGFSESNTPCLLTEDCIPLICDNGVFLVL